MHRKSIEAAEHLKDDGSDKEVDKDETEEEREHREAQREAHREAIREAQREAEAADKEMTNGSATPPSSQPGGQGQPGAARGSGPSPHSAGSALGSPVSTGGATDEHGPLPPATQQQHGVPPPPPSSTSSSVSVSSDSEAPITPTNPAGPGSPVNGPPPPPASNNTPPGAPGQQGLHPTRDPDEFRNNSIACLRAKALEHSAKMLSMATADALIMTSSLLGGSRHGPPHPGQPFMQQCDANANSLPGHPLDHLHAAHLLHPHHPAHPDHHPPPHPHHAFWHQPTKQEEAAE